MGLKMKNKHLIMESNCTIKSIIQTGKFLKKGKLKTLNYSIKLMFTFGMGQYLQFCMRRNNLEKYILLMEICYLREKNLVSQLNLIFTIEF